MKPNILDIWKEVLPDGTHVWSWRRVAATAVLIAGIVFGFLDKTEALITALSTAAALGAAMAASDFAGKS